MKKIQELSKRWTNYLERVTEYNEREFGTGSLSLATFDRLSRRKA